MLLPSYSLSLLHQQCAKSLETITRSDQALTNMYSKSAEAQKSSNVLDVGIWWDHVRVREQLFRTHGAPARYCIHLPVFLLIQGGRFPHLNICEVEAVRSRCLARGLRRKGRFPSLRWQCSRDEGVRQILVELCDVSHGSR